MSYPQHFKAIPRELEMKYLGYFCVVEDRYSFGAVLTVIRLNKQILEFL